QHILSHESSRERPLRSAFVVNPMLSADELFEALFDELEIHPSAPTKPARLRALHELLLSSYRNNGAVVVIIDEAHLMPPSLIEEVRLLMNLDNYPVNVLQIILCGQPELMPLLQKPELAALRQRISVVTKLRALTLIETRAYIAERLHVAGLRGDGPFTTAALEEIYRLTGGVPRLINSVCDHTLAIGCRRQAKKLGADFVHEAAEEMGLSQLSSGRDESSSLPAAGLAATGS
ncbi:MAG TPA: AAA family ATPase, partial [Candidatus Sulfotelmatobacter sp.]|nr:AAA family ATPase [Candidatus Sulfotelmatobacter sp.]